MKLTTAKRLSLAYLAALLLFAGVACKPVAAPAPPPPPPIAPMSAETQKFFVDWLKAHGEEHVVVDARGVGLEGNATRLRAAPYEVKQAQKGWSVEMEFRVALPSGGEIVEYVAGLADDQTKAQHDSMANFVLTTFHVIYKSFMNAGDPHQTIQNITIDGKGRELAQGDVYVRGGAAIEGEALQAISDRLREVVTREHLNAGPHWFKVVYAQNQGKPMMVAVTRDNQDAPALNAVVQALPWPAKDGVYMAKQFMVIK